MATKKKTINQEVTQGKGETPEGDRYQERGSFFEVSRKILLASIGAVALAQDEIEDFVNQLVERGEIAEKEGLKLLGEIRERRKKKIREMEARGLKQVEEILGRLNVPTKADIEMLHERIALLTKKVDELKKE
mgnify:CR=1 FL=1